MKTKDELTLRKATSNLLTFKPAGRTSDESTVDTEAKPARPARPAKVEKTPG